MTVYHTTQVTSPVGKPYDPAPPHKERGVCRLIDTSIHGIYASTPEHIHPVHLLVCTWTWECGCDDWAKPEGT